MPIQTSIAFVANTSWSIYKFRLSLIKKLLDSGFAIIILAPRDNYSGQFSNLPGLTYIELKKFHGKSMAPRHGRQLYKELLEHYRRIRPGLIFHYTIKANIFGSIAAAKAGSPCVSVVTGLGYAFSGRRILQMVARFLYRRALRTNREVWFLNSDDRDIFIRQGIVQEEKTFVLPGEGVDTDIFYPAPFEAKQEPLIFLLIARIIRHKGIYEFIRAAELLRKKGLEVRFQLLGFSDEENPVAIPMQEVEEWVNQKSIEYLGQTDNVIPFIERADCIVLPSYREGMPLSLLEGASMCKALIATDTAGCREIVVDGLNGYLCRKKDASDLAEKMENYYRLSAADKRRMGVEGRERVLASFTIGIVASIYQEKLGAMLYAQDLPRPGIS